MHEERAERRKIEADQFYFLSQSVVIKWSRVPKSTLLSTWGPVSTSEMRRAGRLRE
jgi:hypothetical protein